MSSSGSVPSDFQITTSANKIAYPYRDIVTEIKLYRRQMGGCLLEATVPCIARGRGYQLDFSCDLSPFKEHFGKKLPKQQEVELLFFKKNNEREKVSAFDRVTVKKLGNWEFKDLKIKCCYYLNIANRFCSSKSDSVLYIGLKVRDMVLRYLVMDIAVLSHSSQISPSYKIVGGTNLQHSLRNCFWYDTAIFTAPESKKKVKVEVDGSKSVANKSDEDESLPSRHGLRDLIADAQSFLVELKNLDASENPDIHEPLADIAQRVVAAFGMYIPPPLPSLGDQLLPEMDFI